MKLAPEDPWVRLTRAESLLASPGDARRGGRSSRRLAADTEVGGRGGRSGPLSESEIGGPDRPAKSTFFGRMRPRIA